MYSGRHIDGVRGRYVRGVFGALASAAVIGQKRPKILRTVNNENQAPRPMA